MEAVALAFGLAALIISVFALGLAGAAFLRIYKVNTPGVTRETTVELDLPQTVLDQLPDRKAPQQTMEDLTRMLRESNVYEE